MQLYWMSSFMKLNSCWGAKTSWYFLKNYSMISADALKVSFLSLLMIINEGSLLTTLFNVSFMKLNSCGGAKASWYFLKNYSMVSTDALKVIFLSPLTIINEGSSLTIIKKDLLLTNVNEGLLLAIVNETTSFI